MQLLLITPPVIDVASPYPATAYLKGFLHSRGIECVQRDLGIEFICSIFSKQGVGEIADKLETEGAWPKHGDIAYFLAERRQYESLVEPVVRFLQGKDPGLALRIAKQEFLPRIPSYSALMLANEQQLMFGFLEQALGRDELRSLLAAGVRLPEDLSEIFKRFIGIEDRAKYLASRFLMDISKIIHDGIDSRFVFPAFGKELGEISRTFDPLQGALEAEPTILDRMVDRLAEQAACEARPDFVGITVPMSSNIYPALRIARVIRQRFPSAKIALGGGYSNTQLRSLSDPRLFDYVDYVTQDDGEKPLLCLLGHLEGKHPETRLLRTFVRKKGRVEFISDRAEHDIPHGQTGTPSYAGLPLDLYLGIVDSPRGIFHRRACFGYRWNKLTLAHGCYWKRCTFCDTSLDYIGRYDPASADIILDRMIAVAKETGSTNFWFVDEAMPPVILRALSQRILERNLTFSWGGMIRWDKSFTPELARLMARAGCIWAAGGLEIAHERLLKVIDKGITVEQTVRAMKALSDAKINVYAMLIYGYPTETEQETSDSFEVVRQMFEAKILDSATLSRFALTPHSPIGRNPGKYGLKIRDLPPVTFAEFELEFDDMNPVDHDRFGAPLEFALSMYEAGVGVDRDIRTWFEKGALPKTTVPKNYVRRILKSAQPAETRASLA